jgi:hypothetical protein
MQTPAVLVTFLIIDYFCQEFFQWFGFQSIAAIFSLILTLSIIALATWTYSRYSGNIRDIAGGIDLAITWIWEHYLSPTWGQSMTIVNQVQSVSFNIFEFLINLNSFQLTSPQQVNSERKRR